MTFNRTCFVWFLVILAAKILIALFLKDRFFRPWFGDVLVEISIEIH